jgi:hypothetical protein
MGAKYWNDINRYSQQNNNSSEKMAGHLETCGPTSAINCYDALHLVPAKPATFGGGEMQPEDALANVMNNTPKYSAELEKIRQGIWKTLPVNEVPQYYPYFAKLCLKARCEMMWDGNLFNYKSHLDKGYALMVCLKKPGHYVCLKNYDNAGRFFYANDPYNGRDGIDGFNRHFSFDEIESNTESWYLLWYPEEHDY